MPALSTSALTSSANLDLNLLNMRSPRASDVSPADSKDHVKIIRAQGYGKGGHVLGNAHKGLIGGVGGGGGYGHSGGGYGGHGGGGHFVYTQADDDCPSGVNPILGLALLAGLAAAAAVLIVQITMMGRRRRKRAAGAEAEALTEYEHQEELVDRVINVLALGECGFGESPSFLGCVNWQQSSPPS